VLVGAVPGALPCLIGWVAAYGNGTIGWTGAWVVFGIQFLWQFPHFWAIAWVMDDDYKKAGFKMLPSAGGRDRNTAFQTMAYTLSLVPLALLLHFFGLFSVVSTILVAVTGVYFALPSFRLYKNLDLQSARKLMYASFIYLPVVQLILMIDKLLR